MIMKKFLIRTWRGIHKGWTTPNLPAHIIELQSQPFIRIFRVIGGISSLTLLGKGYFELNTYGLYVAMLITFMFVLYHFYISYHRTKYIYKIIKSGELEVRKSPLDLYASRLARLILCAKGACEYVPHVGGALGLMLGVDQVLRDSGRDAFFGPLIGQGVNKVIPPKSGLKKWGEDVNRLMSEVDNHSKNDNSIAELISKTKGFENLSDNDRKDFLSALSEVKKAEVSELEGAKKRVRELLDNPPKK
uniref:Uncharacterized protein n=1 Tax=Termitomyces sp. TaxID=1916073 RepID=A0A386TYT4_9AGAR|nr:hypothetical protein C0995_000092 [Termitomyces sp.]AYE93268.1 hypothetical protein C0995_000040 [Termitomyces sp.]